MDIAGVFCDFYNQTKMQKKCVILVAKWVQRKIVADWDTGNINIAGSQRSLSSYQGFQFGKSRTNQRIELF